MSLSVVLLVCGEYGDSLQAVRVLSILSIPFVAVNIKPLFMKEQSLCYLIYFFMLWYLYNLLSMAWTPDIGQASKELLYYAVHFNIVLSLILFSRKANFPILSIIVGWIVLMTLLVPISLNEIATDYHLSVSRAQPNVFRNGVEEFRRHYAAATFYNYNDYNSILVWALLFLLMGLFYFKNRISKICISLLVLASLYILITNASRGALIASLLVVFTFVYYYSNKSFILFAVFLFFIAGIFIVVFLTTDVFDTIMFRTGGNSSQLIEAGSRNSIYENAWYIIKNYCGTGSGVGSVTTLLRETKISKYAAPHNMFLETLVQYGALIFALFLFWIYYPTVKLLSNKNYIGIQFLGMSFLVSFAVSAIVSSTYLLRPALWVVLGCLFVVYEYTQKSKIYERS